MTTAPQFDPGLRERCERLLDTRPLRLWQELPGNDRTLSLRHRLLSRGLAHINPARRAEVIGILEEARRWARNAAEDRYRQRRAPTPLSKLIPRALAPYARQHGDARRQEDDRWFAALAWELIDVLDPDPLNPRDGEPTAVRDECDRLQAERRHLSCAVRYEGNLSAAPKLARVEERLAALWDTIERETLFPTGPDTDAKVMALARALQGAGLIFEDDFPALCAAVLRAYHASEQAPQDDGPVHDGLVVDTREGRLREPEPPTEQPVLVIGPPPGPDRRGAPPRRRGNQGEPWLQEARDHLRRVGVGAKLATRLLVAVGLITVPVRPEDEAEPIP